MISSSEKGLAAERRVARAYQARGYRWLLHRYRHALGEIDLCLEDSRGRLILVEVKTLSWSELAGARMSRKQRSRLFRVAESIRHKSGREVCCHLAFVHSSGQIQIFEDGF